MASIVKRGKTYAIAYYEGEGKDRHQVWESGLSYTAAKSRKATIEYEMEQNTHVEHTEHQHRQCCIPQSASQQRRGKTSLVRR